MRSFKRAIVPLLAISSAIAGCGVTGLGSGSSDMPKGPIVIIQEQQEPDTLNPVTSVMMATVDALGPILSGLVGVDDKMRYFGDLATTVPTLANGGVKPEGKGMEVIYHLRKNAKWQDGVPVTSADVRFTWQVQMDPAVQASSRTGWDQITSIDDSDPHTAIVHFKSIYAPYLNLFGAILPEHLLESHLKKLDAPGDSDFNHCAWNRAPIGSGPFKFKKWVSGDEIEYVANPDYYRGKPKLAGIIMKFVPDNNTAFVMLKSGDIDIYQSASLTQLDQLKLLDGVKIEETPSVTYEHLDFNLKNPILAQLPVRQAIAYAIDKKTISRVIYKGIYPPAYSDQVPESYAYNKAVESFYPFDPAKAEQILDAAGWKPGPDGIREKDGKKLSFTIVTTAGNKPREEDERVIQWYLRNVGIQLAIQNVPGPTLFGQPDGLLYKDKFDLALYAYSSSPDPDDIYIWNSTQVPPNGQNETRFSNPEVDRLTVEGDQTMDLAKRAAIYRQIQLDLAKYEPMVPLLYWTTIDAINTRVHGFRPNPTSAGNLWNTQDWYVKDSK